MKKRSELSEEGKRNKECLNEEKINQSKHLGEEFENAIWKYYEKERSRLKNRFVRLLDTNVLSEFMKKIKDGK